MQCLLCDSKLTTPFLALGNLPLSNHFVLPEGVASVKNYPLDMFFCAQCHLVQVPEYVAAKEIFSSAYPYQSSFSTTWQQHCQNYAEKLKDLLALDEKSLVIEVASNDGCLIEKFKAMNIAALGIEPAKQVADIAKAKGLNVDNDFLNLAKAQSLIQSNQQADLIVANNVLAHNPNLKEFAQSLAMLIKPEGMITLEFPHLLKLLQGVQFDTVYHEHFCYFSLHVVEVLFAEYGLQIWNVDELATHGGSLRVYLQRQNCARAPVLENIEAIKQQEQRAGLNLATSYQNFASQVEHVKQRLLDQLKTIKQQGKTIAAYGAPAKGNTLLNYCGITTDLIAYTVDKNPLKQNKVMPGSGIPIYAPAYLLANQPDYILILPWNIADEIKAQLSEVAAWGGQFILPIEDALYASDTA